MDLTQYRSKLIGNEDERAVSPVIGVILMVAITVILAAVIAAFVLDLGQSQSASASASVQFDSENSTHTTVTWIESDRVDDDAPLTVQNQSGTITVLTDVGDSESFAHGGDSVSVVTTYQGENSTVQTWNP